MKYTAHEFALASMASTSSPDSYDAGNAEVCEIDCKGYRELLWLFLLGEFQANGTVVFQGRECDTSGGTFADVTGALAPASSTYTTSNADKVYTGRLELMKRLRYQNVKYTVGTAAVEFAIIGILLDKVELPVTQTNTNVFSV